MQRTTRSLVLALAFTACVTAGCGSARDVVDVEEAAASSTPTPASPQTATQPLDAVSTHLPDVGDPMPAFRSPSGNIVCRLDEQGARCAIDDYSYTPPRRPGGCADDDWGSGLAVDETGGHFVCDLPSLAGRSPELGYGTSTVIGDYGCVSRRTGVTCLHTGSRHGFLVSRERTGTF